MRTMTPETPAVAIKPEDRGIVVAVATQIFCARVQANASKHGYTPDLEMCVGEAAALLRQVDTHMPKARSPRPRTAYIDVNPEA